MLLRVLSLTFAVVIFNLLTGCGQTGPLYLPTEPAPKAKSSVEPTSKNPTSPVKTSDLTKKTSDKDDKKP